MEQRLIAAAFAFSVAAGACGGPSELDVDAADPSSAAWATTAAGLTGGRSYLVKLADGVSAGAALDLIGAAGGTLVARYPNLGIVLARSTSAGFASTLRTSAAIESVGAATAVASVIDPVTKRALPRGREGSSTTRGADPLSFRQWNLDQIRGPQAHGFSVGKRSVLVGVLDSGIDVTHPDMAGQVDASASVSCVGGIPNAATSAWSQDVIGHGTHVSGIIAAAKNDVGVVGVAPGVSLAAIKVADDVDGPNFGFVFADAFVCAIDWAIEHRVAVMNASLTIDPYTNQADPFFCARDEPEREAVARIVRGAISEAARRKVPLVAATGNSFMDLYQVPGATPGNPCQLLPVQVPHVIGVSALGYTQKLAFYSNHGFGGADLAAPGGDNLVPNPAVTEPGASNQVLGPIPATSLLYQAAAEWDGQLTDCSSGTCSTYAYLQGTSSATPHVTGVAALAISRFGRMTPDTLLALLSLTARPLACPSGPYDPGETMTPSSCRGPALYNSFYGAGEIDALAVVR